MCPCLIWFRLFTLELLTALVCPCVESQKNSVDLLGTSEIDMIVGAYVNVQAGERGWHVGVSQVTHVHMQYEVLSLTQSPTGPHYRRSAELRTHAA